MEKIFYILERIYNMTHIPVRYYDSKCEMVLLSFGYNAGGDPIRTDYSLRHNIIKKLSKSKYPVLEFEDIYIYGACYDDTRNIIIYGPVCVDPTSDWQLSQYKSLHGIDDVDFRIKRRSLNEMCATLATTVFSTVGERIKELDIALNVIDETHPKNDDFINQYQEYELEQVEKNIQRHNFSEEMSFTLSIKNGDPNAVKTTIEKNLESFTALSVGKLAEKSIKQSEYMACTAIILASRAAIEGGLDSLSAYLMSDLFLQRLERCNGIGQIYILIAEMAVSFAEKVRLSNESRSVISYVEQCKNIVSRHLNKSFTLEEVADQIGINKSYLSRKFAEETGMGIQKYAQKCRVEAAANMLKYSDESLLSIANYLCFSSQSHFGRVFKDEMKITPQKYRNKYKLQDFSENR